ncbi:MAG: aminotransferase class I/II-fold pyridoxal phosphate-dependent enzyme [Thermoanaerobaculia bacterium]
MRRIFDLALNHSDVVSLGLGEPDSATPAAIVEAGVAALRRGDTGYTDVPGLGELRSAVARHLGRRYGVTYDPDTEIVITAGTTEGLFAALTVLLDPGDEVLIPQPSFLSYVPSVSLVGGNPVTVATRVEDRFEVAVTDLETALTGRTKLLLLNYPNNPTGAVLGRSAARRVAAFLKRHDLLLISDESYDRLVYGTEHVCMASVDGLRQRTLLLGGFSKAYAMTGWRLGYAAGPAELIAALLRAHQYMVMCAPSMAQQAALRALAEGEESVETMRRKYDRRRRLLVAGLDRLGLECCEPKGAFFAFPSVKNTGLSGEEFAERLVEEERVLVVPGTLFGEAGHDFVRCSYSASTATIEEALVRIERFVSRLQQAKAGKPQRVELEN